MLVIELELERDQTRAMLVCDSREDEMRLRLWLRGAASARSLELLVRDLLDLLDRIDEDTAA
jgi:hypothetical protein